MITSKICAKCEEERPTAEFHPNKIVKDGFDSYCKTCRNTMNRKWRQENPEKTRASDERYRKSARGKASQRRYSRLTTLRKYGLTPDDYNRMFTEQNGYCAICKRHQSEFEISLVVDHNDETGVVRELLCGSCNAGIGMLQHDEEFLRNAIVYLRKHNG